jgi:PAS domain S-box-containing protein
MLIFGVLVSGKVFVMFEDITEQQQATEKLRDSENRYQIFTSNTSDFVYKCIRREGEPFRIEWMAGATEAITGHTIAELKQMTCWMKIVHPADQERVNAFLLALSPGDRAAIDFRITTKNGEVHWIHESSYCQSGDNPGELLHYGSSQDITERKLVEAEVYRLNSNLESLVAERTLELLRSNRDLTSFCYAISHELRAPVARLKGLSRALQEEWDENPADAAYCARRIEVASDELQLVINSVLKLSRLSQATFVPQSLDLSALVREITESLAGESPERRVEFVIADGITVNGDLSLMRLCLENLLGNAFKYTARESSARIEFDRDTSGSTFFVRDNGVGFAMDHAENLFEPFTRLHPEEEFAGSGIGLATVQRIIERHGGRVWAESTPGHGAAFYLTLTPSQGDSHES